MNEHMVFKMNQTAAAYVAGALDEETSERFELHLLECVECSDDVEVWRALKRSSERKPTT